MDNSNSHKNPQSDEIDLSQFVMFIKKGFDNLFRFILRVFLYLKKNLVKLALAAVVGLLIGIGLNTIVNKKLKIDVIVKPNLESKNYLYDVIAEINANIKAKNETFFKPIGIEVDSLDGFEVIVAPIETQSVKSTKEDIQYLQALEKFKDETSVLDAVKNEIYTKSTWTQRISFYYVNAEVGHAYSSKLMDYINSNPYYNELANIYVENAMNRIAENENLVKQIDDLVTSYSQKLAKDSRAMDGQIVLDREEYLDITGMLNLKKLIVQDIEKQKVEIQNHKEAIRVISFGQGQEVQKSFFGKNPVLIPTILIAILLVIDLLKYFNRKAKELEMQ